MGSAEHPGQPPQPPVGDAGDWETAGLGVRVNEIVDAVEREAAKLRHEAELEAAQIRRQAEDEARRYVEQARQQSESLVARRMERIQELSDSLLARAEEVLERLDYAVPVKEGFENLVRALGETAERLANQDYAEFSPPSWESVRAPAPPGAPGQAPPPPPPPPQAQPAPAPTPPAEAPSYGAPAGTGPAGQPASAPRAAGWQELDDAHRIAIQMATAGSTRGEVEAHLAQTPAPTRSSVLDEIFGAGTPPETRVPWAAPQR